ncbi:MAG: NADH-quinone oxidoreductase subunit H [Planctomycetota bacterium]|jgi:NADH-quinone oxidoreductase subunit H
MKGNPTLTFLQGVAPEAVPSWLLPLVAAGLSVGIALSMITLLALSGPWLERKISGHIQCRNGPMYAGGWHGWAQSIADGVKLLMKEDMVPLGADRIMFMIAPAIVLGAMFGAFVAMPLSPDFYFADVNLGVFFILGMSSLTTIGVIMAGWASNSKWSLYGAMREAAQVVAYEIPLGISLMVALIVAGTFNLREASALQGDWYGMGWFVFKNPIFMIPASIIFFVAALAENKRAPFDLPEAESELVAGFLTEYSGIRWSFFFMEEYAAMYLLSLVGAVFWFGGFQSPFTYLAIESFGADSFIANLVGALTLIVKSMCGIFLMMWVRWTLPRVRIDQVMTMGYKYLTPMALVCVLGAAIWEAIF